MADTLREVLEEALKEHILVIKLRKGREVRYLKNPTPEELAEVLESRVLSFAQVLWPKDPMRAYPYVLQFHVRGDSVHVDFRHAVDGERVSGETITVPFGLPKESKKVWEEEISRCAKEVLGYAPEGKDWDKVSFEDKEKIRKRLAIPWPEVITPILERWKEDFLDWQTKKVFVSKAVQDWSWMRIDVAVFPPGSLGTTRYEWAFLYTIDRGVIEYGVQKPEYREYFLRSERGLLGGKFNFTFLPREQVAKTMPAEDVEGKLGRSTWVGLMFPSKVQQPYMLSPRAIEDDYLPPVGYPCLPREVRELLPKEFAYWRGSGRRRKRDLAVAWAKENLEFYERKDPLDVPEWLARRAR